MIEENVEPLDVEDLVPDEAEDDKSKDDVVVAPDCSHFATWPAFYQAGQDAKKGYETYQFPAHIAAKEHTFIWTGFVSEDMDSIYSLLSTASVIGGSNGTPLDISGLEELFHCTISYSMGGDTIYIGSESQDSVQRLVSLLDNLVTCFVSSLLLSHRL